MVEDITIYQLVLTFVIPGLTALVVFVTKFSKQESRTSQGQTSLSGLREDFHNIRDDLHSMSKEIQDLTSTNNLHNHMFLENKESINRIFSKLEDLESAIIKSRETIQRNSQRIDTIEELIKEGYYDYIKQFNKGPPFTKSKGGRDTNMTNNNNNGDNGNGNNLALPFKMPK